MISPSDVFTQLQPRNVCRRERKPGARERHSAQRQRFTPNTDNANQETTPRKTQTSHPYPNKYHKTSYCMDSAVSEFGHKRTNKENESREPELVISRYKELSTIEEIRANMMATAKRQKSAPLSHVPDWMLNLDINLDVSVTDIIPPFEEGPATHKSKETETYNEIPSLIFLENDSDDEGDDEYMVNEEGENREKEKCKHIEKRENVSRVYQRPSSRKDTGQISQQTKRSGSSGQAKRPKSNTFRIAGRFSPTYSDNSSPRRYQGDKRVMSLQQGGIRSTPFQPKAKKFINQMITFRHMKHHERKLKVAKPAVDTRMPQTFKIALDRKHLVEQRLSDSWSRSYNTSTPTKTSTDQSKSQNSTRSR